MKIPVRCINVSSVERSRAEMSRIGVDAAGIRIMLPKQFHYNLKVEGLMPAQANVLKQDMLSIGGEAAVARGAASCSIETTGAVVSGTMRQIDALVEKLALQSFGLPEVARALRGALVNLQKTGHVVASRTRLWETGRRTLIMGILNVTPDSFSDGGRFIEPEEAVAQGLRMVEEGADWIDVGGESTRPWAEPVSADEELRRVMPVVQALAKKGVAISIDTMKASVARAALESGAEIVNDVSAMSADAAMAGVCREFNAAVILMHMRGTPKTMQYDAEYDDIMGAVFANLAERVEFALRRGIGGDKIIVDPGIGFGKSVDGSLALLKNLGELRSLGLPILVGASRKSFIGKVTGQDAGGRLLGTVAAHTAAILNGAEILRVHDVAGAVMAARVTDAIRNVADGH